MIRRLLRALRFDDFLALLFSGALLLLASTHALQFDFTTLRGVLFLFTYYALLFSIGRWLVRTSRLNLPQKRTVLAWLILLIVAFILLIPGRDMMLLEKPKYLLVAVLPILLAWWVTPGQLSPSASVPDTEDSLTGYQLLRDFGPFLVSEVCYMLLHDVIHRISPIDRDEWLIEADRLLFGGAATRGLEPYVRPWLTEWFSMTYSLFLIFPLTLALWFVAGRQRAALRHLLQAVVLCNYLGYLGYLMVPAVGPMYTLTYEIPLTGGWFYQVKEAMDQLGRVPRDNFPSLHTANTFVVLLIVWRYARSLAWIYLPLGGSCIAATIYLRYHYSVDVLAGFILGGVVTWSVPRLALAWQSAIQRWTGGFPVEGSVVRSSTADSRSDEGV